MRKTGLSAVAAILFAGCASYPKPTEHLATSTAAVRGAEEAGAQSVPNAALYLKLASEELNAAHKAMKNDENRRADALTIRAYNDAELALALTRQQQAQDKLAAFVQQGQGGENPAVPAETGPTPPPVQNSPQDQSRIP